MPLHKVFAAPGRALSWPSRILYIFLALLMLVWLLGVDAAPHLPGPIQPWDLEVPE